MKRYSAKTRAELVEAFTHARERIQRKKEYYICYALVGHPHAAKAQKLIHRLMGKPPYGIRHNWYCLERWLQYHRISQPGEINPRKMRSYRIRWLTHLIHQLKEQ